MTDSTGNDNQGAGGIDDVGRLIHYAGAREEVRPDRMDSARERVAAHWEQVVIDRKGDRSRHPFKLISIAASIAVLAVVSWLYTPLEFSPQSVQTARIDRVLGSARLDGEAAVRDAIVGAESIIETGPESRLALRMASGKSLRIDTSSRLLVHSSDYVSLQAGAIYVDTDGASADRPILISTPVGTAQDIGTQFQLRLVGSNLIVGVRDGLVEIAQPDGNSVAINKGQSVELGASGQKSERVLPNDDPSWDWIETVIPVFDLQGASLEQYLNWYANERGVSLKWEDATSEMNARAVILSGSIEGASLDEGLQIVQQISHFDVRTSGESIWVKVE